MKNKYFPVFRASHPAGKEAEPIRLGPFEFDECIGTGAMGQVWRGRHIKEDVPVALKVILRKEAQEKRFIFAFRDEVRSMAALNHPGIARVFDFGIVTDDADFLSGGEMLAGSPYLVMEYADFGALEQMEPDPGWSWKKLSILLLSLLDALAHSHARGVIHRDIKPGNILLTQSQQGWPGIKIADFGLAYLTEHIESPSISNMVGTPYYMAPEQFLGKWRDYGPWTDLYALGCLAFELITGEKPFKGANIPQVARGHLEDPLPSLPTWMEGKKYPPGFEDWLGKMVEKDFHRRFQTAADAAYGLLALGDGPHDYDMKGFTALWELSSTVIDEEATASADSESGIFPTWTLESLRETVGDAEHIRDAHHPGGHSPRPPIPGTWRYRALQAQPLRLIGAGQGLFNLRPMPVVGRGRELDKLWAALRQCDREGKYRSALLKGVAGAGRPTYRARSGDRSGIGAAHDGGVWIYPSFARACILEGLGELG